MIGSLACCKENNTITMDMVLDKCKFHDGFPYFSLLLVAGTH